MHEHEYSRPMARVGDPSGSLDVYENCSCGAVRHTYSYLGEVRYTTFDEPGSFGAGYAYGLEFGLGRK